MRPTKKNKIEPNKRMLFSIDKKIFAFGKILILKKKKKLFKKQLKNFLLKKFLHHQLSTLLLQYLSLNKIICQQHRQALVLNYAKSYNRVHRQAQHHLLQLLIMKLKLKMSKKIN